MTDDYAGNLTGDGVWTYEYDPENRLIKMASTEIGKSMEFTYDYMGRRATKTVWDNASYSGTSAEDIHFVYHGWNLIAELDGKSGADDNSRRLYGWGPDVSGGNGAGGVGGLLSVIIHNEGTYHPIQDRLGNVYALVDVFTGDVDAAYEYDPFGNVLRASGFVADLNYIGFSTKYTDRESNLVYFGFRFYNPEQGRFMNRDVIRESGGINLYAFAKNNPIGNFDFLGMKGMVPGDEGSPDNIEMEELEAFEVEASDPDFRVNTFSSYKETGFDGSNTDSILKDYLKGEHLYSFKKVAVVETTRYVRIGFKSYGTPSLPLNPRKTGKLLKLLENIDKVKKLYDKFLKNRDVILNNSTISIAVPVDSKPNGKILEHDSKLTEVLVVNSLERDKNGTHGFKGTLYKMDASGAVYQRINDYMTGPYTNQRINDSNMFNPWTNDISSVNRLFFFEKSISIGMDKYFESDEY